MKLRECVRQRVRKSERRDRQAVAPFMSRKLGAPGPARGHSRRAGAGGVAQASLRRQPLQRVRTAAAQV